MSILLKGHPIITYLSFSFAAAILYCSSTYFFIRDDSFSSGYFLYIGNILFACVIAFFILTYNSRRRMNAKVQVMIAAGHITAVMGILISCILILMELWVFTPSIFHQMSNNTSALEKAPATLQGNGRGLLLVLFMNAIFGNIAASSFISIIFPFAVKKNQKYDAEKGDTRNY